MNSSASVPSVTCARASDDWASRCVMDFSTVPNVTCACELKNKNKLVSFLYLCLAHTSDVWDGRVGERERAY
jgi:hypothetical protein